MEKIKVHLDYLWVITNKNHFNPLNTFWWGFGRKLTLYIYRYMHIDNMIANIYVTKPWPWLKGDWSYSIILLSLNSVYFVLWFLWSWGLALLIKNNVVRWYFILPITVVVNNVFLYDLNNQETHLEDPFTHCIELSPKNPNNIYDISMGFPTLFQVLRHNWI